MRTLVLLVLVLCSSLLAQTKRVEKVSVTPTPPGSGQEMFAHYCAACHGAAGKGDGPAAPSFKKAPRDLTRLTHDNGGKYPEAHVSAVLSMEECCVHGSKVMPLWGPLLSSVSQDRAEVRLRIANLVKYIETLQVP